jgi:plastocyanin
MAILRRKLTVALLSLIFLYIGACAAPQTATKVSVVGDKKDTVEVTADNFNFEPSIIEVKAGDTLFLKITNISSSSHNLTVKDPDGKVIQNVDLPENKTTKVELRFKQPGTYEFYCNKPFHKTMGMKGHFEVIAGP